MVKRKVEVVATGVQLFEDRFPGKRRRLGENLPVSEWRCNLTGLSQEHNLWFCAYSTEIYVYEPRFPSQKIGEPVLIIPSQPSSPGLRGYIDRDEPHSINNLVVAFLGKEEIVATVRDDGDVEAFLVRHIVQAIERRSLPGSFADDIKPVFLSNVGISAWGLAVHTRARILAVSSNLCEVTIFKFALLDEFDPSDPAPEGDAQPSTEDQNNRQRRTDVTHNVLNGEANIPNIAFCNTGDDTKARWLLTTDISGICRVMDLHTVLPVQAFRFGPSLYQPFQNGYDRMNAGWGVMFLDPRSFHAEDSLQAALGMQPDEQLPDARSNPRVWDIGKTVKNLRDVADEFGVNDPRQQRRRDRATLRSTTSEHDESGSPTRQSSPVDGRSEYTEAEEEEMALTSAEALDAMHGMIDEWDDPEDEGTEDTISPSNYYNGERVCSNLPQFVRTTDLCADLPAPILHTSIRNVYLLQPSSQRHEVGPFRPPMVGIAAPLRQSIQQGYSTLNMFERLNMHAYIPSLGVVVIASQRGRAMILSLTKISPFVKLPPEFEGLGRKTNYAMRAEAIVPFASQERVNARPMCPLHGIAVGPMQGTEDLPDDKKRWRLMLMYQDHAVLSYEIARRRGMESGLSLDSLVI